MDSLFQLSAQYRIPNKQKQRWHIEISMEIPIFFVFSVHMLVNKFFCGLSSSWIVYFNCLLNMQHQTSKTNGEILRFQWKFRFWSFFFSLFLFVCWSINFFVSSGPYEQSISIYLTNLEHQISKNDCETLRFTLKSRIFFYLLQCFLIFHTWLIK